MLMMMMMTTSEQFQIDQKTVMFAVIEKIVAFVFVIEFAEMVSRYSEVSLVENLVSHSRLKIRFHIPLMV